ncbi:MAG: anti-sigma factor antagonist [Planctomycetaceae bacterium]
MTTLPSMYRVLQTGKRVVVGFSGPRIPDDHRFTAFRDNLLKLIQEHSANDVAFDLAGVKVVPSLMLGLMAWLSRNKVDVSVYHPSDEIRDTLAFTELDSIIDVCDTDL